LRGLTISQTPSTIGVFAAGALDAMLICECIDSGEKRARVFRANKRVCREQVRFFEEDEEEEEL